MTPTYRIRDVAKVLTSNVDKVIEPTEIPVRLCNYVDVYKNNFIHEHLPFSKGSATKTEIQKFKVLVDDVIITKDSETADDIGVPALVKSTADNLVCGYHLSILRADTKKLYGPYLYWHLLSKKSREDFGNAANGVTRFGLTLAGIKSIPIYLPDLSTQRAIADFLDRETARIDALIKKKTRFVELMKELQNSEVSNTLSRIDAPLWRIRHLGKVKNGAGFPIEHQGNASNEIPFFKVKHLTVNGLDQRIIQSDDTITHSTAKALRATVFPIGTIIFAKIGAALLLGRFSMLGVDGCIDNNLAAFVVNPCVADPDFLLLCFERLEMPLLVQPGAVPSLATEKFLNQSVPLPSLAVQRNVVSEIREKIQRNEGVVSRTLASIDRLKEYRSALITAAVTGQIDVTKWKRSGSTDRQLDAIQEEVGA